MKKLILFSVIALTLNLAMAADDIEVFYQQQGASSANPDNGKVLWMLKNGERSCSSCHGDNLNLSGKHIKTSKPIDAMAYSKNPSRYQDQRKLEKWFLRNCKWTLDRECSAQEKLDVLSWLKSL